MLYLDEASDRRRDEHVSNIEAARLGYVFARNQKAHDKWRRELDRRVGAVVSLSGAALESAVMNVARMFPQNVVRGAT